MKKFKFLAILGFVAILLAGCTSNGTTDVDSDSEGGNSSGEEAAYGGEWSRVATYTDGVDMGTGPAQMNFLGDGTFVSTTSVCTANGNYEVLLDDADEELGDNVLHAGQIAMSYVQSNCPGFTLSALTYDYEVTIGEDGGETLTMNAEYEGHVVTEVYTR